MDEREGGREEKKNFCLYLDDKILWMWMISVVCVQIKG